MAVAPLRVLVPGLSPDTVCCSGQQHGNYPCRQGNSGVKPFALQPGVQFASGVPVSGLITYLLVLMSFYPATPLHGALCLTNTYMLI